MLASALFHKERHPFLIYLFYGHCYMDIYLFILLIDQIGHSNPGVPVTGDIIHFTSSLWPQHFHP